MSMMTLPFKPLRKLAKFPAHLHKTTSIRTNDNNRHHKSANAEKQTKRKQ